MDIPEEPSSHAHAYRLTVEKAYTADLKRESRHHVTDRNASVSDCMIWRVLPQATERQHIGNQIDTAFIFHKCV